MVVCSAGNRLGLLGSCDPPFSHPNHDTEALKRWGFSFNSFPPLSRCLGDVDARLRGNLSSDASGRVAGFVKPHICVSFQVVFSGVCTTGPLRLL